MINNKIKQDIVNAIYISETLQQASQKCNINYKTFRKYAKELGLWKPNPSGKGTQKKRGYKYNLDDIFSNKYPCQTYKLLNRLLLSNLKEKKL